MKYIIDFKMFEGLSDRMTDELYYEVNSMEEFDEIVDTQNKEVINSENKIIFTIVNKYADKHKYTYDQNINISLLNNKGEFISGEDGYNCIYYTSINNRSQELRITIYKLNDSYWAVEVEHYSSCSFRWFICDDIEGLTKLFDEIEIPN